MIATRAVPFGRFESTVSAKAILVRSDQGFLQGIQRVGLKFPREVRRRTKKPHQKPRVLATLQSMFMRGACLLARLGIGTRRLMKRSAIAFESPYPTPRAIIVARCPNLPRRAETMNGNTVPPTPVPANIMPVARPRRCWNHSYSRVAQGRYRAGSSALCD